MRARHGLNVRRIDRWTRIGPDFRSIVAADIANKFDRHCAYPLD
jgi:hypothetical protein